VCQAPLPLPPHPPTNTHTHTQDWAAPIMNLLNPFSESLQSGMSQSFGHLSIGNIFSSSSVKDSEEASNPAVNPASSSSSKPYDKFGYASSRNVDQEIAQAEKSRIARDKGENASSSSNAIAIPTSKPPSSSKKFSHIDGAGWGRAGDAPESSAADEMHSSGMAPGSTPGSANKVQSRSEKWLAHMQKVESRAQSKFGSGLPRADPSTFIKAQNQVSSDEEFHSSDSAEDSGPVVKPFKAKGQRGKEGASAEPKPHPRSLKAAIRQGLQGLGIAAKDDHHPPAKAKDDHEPPAAARKPDRKRGGGLIVAERMRVQGRRMLMVVVVEEEEEVVKRLLFGPGLKPEAIR